MVSSDDLRLRVLRYKHDHPTAGHFGQNTTINLVQREYTWPRLRDFVKDFCKSCTNCYRAKTPRHRPYGSLKQFPIPEKPWKSFSMDFIEQLPASSSYTAILVVVDRLTKQSIFFPTHQRSECRSPTRTLRVPLLESLHSFPETNLRRTTSLPTSS